jgi:antirestriction protein ArdC
MKRKTRVKPDLYQEVTDKIIKKLEEGTAPWRCSWSRYGAAKNYVSGNAYRGINAFLMNFIPVYPIPYYLSFKQAKDLGGNVKKGSKSEKVYFFKSYYKDADGKSITEGAADQLRAAGDKIQFIPFLKSYAVFNVADVEGVEFEIPELQAQQDHDTNQTCEAMIAGIKNPPQFVGGDHNGAWYSPSSDKLNMPPLANFSSPEEYYCTKFHELTHASGHVSRLNRDGITGKVKRGSEEYAREELIAEMGASFLCAATGIDLASVTDNSAAYIAGWLTKLQNDKTLVLKAAAGAQKAADYMLNVER